MEAIHKSTVKKVIRQRGTWKGYIAPSNVSAFHITGGWHLGMDVEFHTLEELEETARNFSYYNCGPELGQRVRFWQS